MDNKRIKMILAAALSCCVLLGGCVSPIQKNSDSAAVESDEFLDDGEVYYVFTGNDGEEYEDEDLNEPSTCPLSKDKIQSLNKNVDDVIAQYPDFSGTVLLASGNRIICEKSFGDTGVKKTKNENGTIYQIGSVTKQFTGTAVMDLIKAGKLSVSDTIDKYFPGYDYDYMKTITIQHLLEMSSGMGDYMAIIEGDEEKLKAYLKAANTSEDAAKKFIVDTIFEGGIFTDPGTTYNYSNSAYYLLGMIIEQLTGMSYRDYLQTNYFDRAKMKDTYFVGDGKDLCTGYSLNELRWISDKDSKELTAEGDYPYLFSAGSVVSTVEDVNKWLALVTGDEIFTPDDRKTIEKSLLFYNYGWNTSDGLWHHSGRTYAYSSQIYADYKTDTRMVILTNVAFFSEINEISLKIYLPLVDAVKHA